MHRPSNAPLLRIDVATGAPALDVVDLILPGPAPLLLSRHYRGQSLYEGALGARWSFGLDAVLSIDATAVVCRGGPLDGAAFAPVAEGRAARQETTGLVLEHLVDAYVLSATSRRAFVFLKRHASGGRIPLSAIREGTGRVIQIERSGGRIVDVRDPLGRSLRFSHSGDRVEAVDLVVAGSTRPRPIARYRYAGGLLRSASGPDGHAEQYDYRDGLMTTYVNRSGGHTYAQYDADGRCLALWTDAGETCHLAYDTVRQTTRVVNGAGAQTLYRHVIGRQVLERIAPSGASQTYYYDEAERLTGHGTPETVHTFQRLDPTDGKLVHLHHEARAAFVQYNDKSLADTATDAFGHAHGFGWSDAHTLVRVTTPGGAVWAFDRDDLGRVVAVRSPEGREVRLTWEPGGLTVSDAEGTRRRETWDDLGRLTECVDRSGRRQSRRYSTDGYLAEVRYEGGYGAEFLHSPAGDLVGVSDSEGRRVRIDRDAFGHVRAVSTASGFSVRLRRDDAGRVVSTDRGGSGPELRVLYDEHGRLHQLQGACDATYAYLRGETTVADAAGRRRYAFSGDLVEWADDGGRRETFTYGSSGNLLTWKRWQNDLGDGALTFEYDPDGRLNTVTGLLRGDDSRSAPERLQPVAVELVYDRDGWLIAIRVDGGGLCLTHDALGRPVDVQGLASPVRLAYDKADRLVRVEAGDHTVDVAYDELDRPTAVRLDGATTDLRTVPPPVWQALLLGPAQASSDDLPNGSTGDAATSEDAAPALSLSLHVVRHGAGLFAHVGPLAVPLWVGCDVRCPEVDPAARQVAVAVRGPAAAFPAVAEGEDAILAWLPDPSRDLRTDHAAVPRSRDVGLPWPLLDAFFLNAEHLEAVPAGAGDTTRHHDDPSREPSGALTGSHGRAVLRAAPWGSRSLRALFPAPDLLAPEGAPDPQRLLAFLDRRA